MRIGELADRVGVTTDTIRFYERHGVLDASLSVRSLNNYRDYDQAAVNQLEIIVQAKGLGFTLAEIRELALLWRSGKLTDDERASILNAKLDELACKRRDLDELEARIRAKLTSN